MMTACGMVEAVLKRTVKSNILPKPIVMQTVTVSGMRIIMNVARTAPWTLTGSAVACPGALAMKQMMSMMGSII